MSKFAIYDTSSGVILKISSVNEIDLPLQIDVDQASLPITGDETDLGYYVVLGSPDVLTQRPVHNISLDQNAIISDGVDTATFSGIEVGTVVLIISAGSVNTLTINDGTLEITVEQFGEYEVIFNLFPHLEYRRIIYGSA